MKALAADRPELAGIYWVEGAGGCSGVYVLEQGRTLIDVGNMYGLADELLDLGSLDRLERILLTHSHFDHVGGMAEIYQFAAPDLYLHPLAKAYLALHPEPFPSFFNALESANKIKPIADGDLLAGVPPLRVIHTPGHTAGDVCFFDESSGALFSGDTVLPQGDGSVGIAAEADAGCGGSPAAWIRGLQRLLRLPVRHLLPGHGRPVFARGMDQIKLALLALYRKRYRDEPEKAWLAIGDDLLAAALFDEARQCVAKAAQLSPACAAAKDLYQRIAEAAARS